MISAKMRAREAVDAVVEETVKAFAPDIAYIRHDFHEDWSGDPAVYFRVVVADGYRGRPFFELSQRISKFVDSRLDLDSMGLTWAYYNFRPVSAQRKMREASWEPVDAVSR